MADAHADEDAEPVGSARARVYRLGSRGSRRSAPGGAPGVDRERREVDGRREVAVADAAVATENVEDLAVELIHGDIARRVLMKQLYADLVAEQGLCSRIGCSTSNADLRSPGSRTTDRGDHRDARAEHHRRSRRSGAPPRSRHRARDPPDGCVCLSERRRVLGGRDRAPRRALLHALREPQPRSGGRGRRRPGRRGGGSGDGVGNGRARHVRARSAGGRRPRRRSARDLWRHRSAHAAAATEARHHLHTGRSNGGGRIRGGHDAAHETRAARVPEQSAAQDHGSGSRGRPRERATALSLSPTTPSRPR